MYVLHFFYYHVFTSQAYRVCFVYQTPMGTFWDVITLQRDNPRHPASSFMFNERHGKDQTYAASDSSDFRLGIRLKQYAACNDR